MREQTPGYFCRISILMSLFFFLQTACADETDAAEETEPDFLERSQVKTTHGINRLAQMLDSIFGDDREYKKSSNSWVRLNLISKFPQYGVPEYDAPIQVRLALPRTENRFSLVVESESTGSIDESPISGDPLTAVTDPAYRGGLRYIIGENENWYAHTEIGLQFGDPMDAFSRGRVGRNTLWAKWRGRFTGTVSFFQSGRRESTTQYDLDRLISPNLLFRNSAKITFLNTIKDSSWAFGNSFYQRFSERRGLQYQVSVLGKHGPLRASTYNLNLRFRQRLQRKWMFIELTPQVSFDEVNGFAASPALILKYEMLFRKPPKPH